MVNNTSATSSGTFWPFQKWYFFHLKCVEQTTSKLIGSAPNKAIETLAFRICRGCYLQLALVFQKCVVNLKKVQKVLFRCHFQIVIIFLLPPQSMRRCPLKDCLGRQPPFGLYVNFQICVIFTRFSLV